MDPVIISQMINSIEDTIPKLEKAEKENKMQELASIKEFILSLQQKIKEELEKWLKI